MVSDTRPDLFRVDNRCFSPHLVDEGSGGTIVANGRSCHSPQQLIILQGKNRQVLAGQLVKKDMQSEEVT